MKEEEGRREHGKENRMISRVRGKNHNGEGAIEVGKEKVSRRGHYGASGRRTATQSALGLASRKPVVGGSQREHESSRQVWLCVEMPPPRPWPPAGRGRCAGIQRREGHRLFPLKNTAEM